MLACDAPKIQVYFIPMLGPAPKWSSYLESVTEELDESFKQTEAAPSTYDDYRFVTRDEVSQLGLSHLLGTPVMRAYMHGFFVDNRLYHKAKNLADPFAYDRYRQQVVQKKLEEERKSRISIAKKLPKVNARLATKLLEDKEKDVDENEKKAEEQPKSLLDDDRFASLFKDDRFKIDEESEEYRVLHPNAPTTQKPRKPNFDDESDSSEESDEGEDVARAKKAEKSGPRMYYGRNHDEIASVPLDQRVSGSEGESKGKSAIQKVTGSRELVYVPESRKGRRSDEENNGGRQRGRRRRKM